MAPTFTPTRQAFRQRVAEVAAKAKARLPEAVNGRIESAAKLVLLHDVTPMADGSIVVGSSTDPLKRKFCCCTMPICRCSECAVMDLTSHPSMNNSPRVGR